MKILVQKNIDRDAIGVTNALAATGRHEIMLWDPDQHDIKEATPDLYIFTDISKLGRYTYNNVIKSARFLFLKCRQPEELDVKGVSLENLPYCADILRYPISLISKELYCDVFYLSNFKTDYTDILKKINLNNLSFRIAGASPVSLPNYIGRLDNPNEISQMCLSAGVCIDFDLEYGLDILKIGGRVITNVENSLEIPTFNENNINEVIRGIINTKKPVLNKYETLIMTYTNLLEHISKLVGVEC